MLKLSRLFLSLLTISSVAVVDAKVTMPLIFGNGMVLQQQRDVPLWGQANNNAQVVITPSWSNKTVRVKADGKGHWTAKIQTPSAGGPYSVVISDGSKLTIKDVMIGEVWLCSGQSNMNQNMSGSNYQEPVAESMDAIVTSENSSIRMFTVKSKMTSQPETNCDGSWLQASPATVPDFSAVAYFFALKLHSVLGVPVGIISASYGGSRVEAWMSKEGVSPFAGNPDVHDASILYNGMLAPLVGYGIRGALWYQGEANIDAVDLYGKLLPAMVQDWRTKWGQGEFPFYYAQIAPFEYNHGEGKSKSSDYMRDMQRRCLNLIPQSGMIVLTDIGEPTTIHPFRKRPVGDRFAYMALAKTYNKKGFPASGPIFTKMDILGDKIKLHFDYTDGGLTTYRKSADGFEIAGADRVFHPAQVRFDDGQHTIIVSSPDVKQPVAVRYAFKDFTRGSIYNYYGLPASTFRTDDW